MENSDILMFFKGVGLIDYSRVVINKINYYRELEGYKWGFIIII